MTIQEKIKQDLMRAMKEKNEEKKSALRVVMGEFGRSDKKALPDDDVVKILKKLINSERETLAHTKSQGDTPYIEILEAYLPRMADETEIRNWIDENIDFTAYKNKMQAMKDIMAHFGPRADGSQVKQILQQM